MDWKNGLIVRIRNYKFEDDGTTRDKYAIVLLVNQTELYLIHSLTTSQNNYGYPAQQYGCSIHYQMPYYFIPKNQVIGNEGFYFEKDTFIFFNQNIRKEDFAKFKLAEQTLFGITPLGILSNEELKRIIKCALKSKLMPIGIEKELRNLKDEL
jgi:hypothetical protein